MKHILMRLLPVATVVMLLISCKENKNKTPATPAKALLMGTWLLDSIDISAIKDSSELDIDAAYLLTDDRFKSIQWIFYEGRMAEVNEGDTMPFPFELKGDSVILTEGSEQEAFVIKKLDSARLVLHTEDTLLYHFKKIKEK